MKSTTTKNRKTTSFKISDQVIIILNSKGISQFFNWAEYEQFYKSSKGAFNKSQAIANKFINQYQERSDFAEYVF